MAETPCAGPALGPETPDRGRQIPQPPRPQIDEVNSAEQTRGRVGQQDLPAVTGGH